MKFTDRNPNWAPNSFTSDVFTEGNSRCLDGMQIGAQRGDWLTCHVQIKAGTNPYCNWGSPGVKGWRFDERAVLQANYECTGSTKVNNCHFVGLSETR